ISPWLDRNTEKQNRAAGCPGRQMPGYKKGLPALYSLVKGFAFPCSHQIAGNRIKEVYSTCDQHSAGCHPLSGSIYSSCGGYWWLLDSVGIAVEVNAFQT